jgi:hypothetical protein
MHEVFSRPSTVTGRYLHRNCSTQEDMIVAVHGLDPPETWYSMRTNTVRNILFRARRVIVYSYHQALYNTELVSILTCRYEEIHSDSFHGRLCLKYPHGILTA